MKNLTPRELKLLPAQRLRELRIKNGFRYASDFAAMHDLSQSTYRSHENGSRGMDVTEAEKYGKLLGAPGWWILTGCEPGEPVAPKEENGEVNKSIAAARDELNAAIEMWFNDGKSAPIRRLAISAYNTLSSIYMQNTRVAANDDKMPESHNEGAAEDFIFFAIKALELLDIKTTKTEQAFPLWIYFLNSKGNKEMLGAVFTPFFPISEAINTRNLSKREFFEAFTKGE